MPEESRVTRRFSRQVEPRAPLVPRAVVVGQIRVAQPGQVEEDDGGGDAAVAVGDDRAVGREPGLLDAPAELVEREEAALARRRRARGGG